MNKLLENNIFKTDLFSIDRFISQFGNFGFLHHQNSVKMRFFDCNEEVEISELEFNTKNHYHTYFINYDEILPIFDFGLFFNETRQIFSDLSSNFRLELDDYLLNINELTTKKNRIYEIKLHFINISGILSQITMNNQIQREVTNYLLDLYQKEIEYLSKLYLDYSDKNNENSESLSERIQQIIDEIVSAKVNKELSIIHEKDKNELLTRSQVLKYFDTSASSLWRWEKDGYFPSYMIGGRKYYKKDEVHSALIKVN
ncbi:MAG: helix-turn-helix domain-containing protein [Flavobacteriales bacterium]|nr:helix-turn-helix domain-containing protein [Flavobacteriales bacterium]MCA0391430.1 helix-turn-helix domain-containing protein [Bacteroidota bacterium]